LGGSDTVRVAGPASGGKTAGPRVTLCEQQKQSGTQPLAQGSCAPTPEAARLELEPVEMETESQFPSRARSARIAQTKRQAKTRTQRAGALTVEDRTTGKIAWMRSRAIPGNGHTFSRMPLTALPGSGQIET
jgi:hypothetical protein